MNDTQGKNDQSYSSSGSEGRLFLAALIALIVLLLTNLLYPDTSTDKALNVGAIRVSPLGTAFVFTAPFILIYAWRARHLIGFRILDVMLPATMTYMAVRGLLVADTANGVALTAGYVAYVLVLYYGTAVLAQRRAAFKVIVITLVCIGFVVITLGMFEFFLERNVLYEGFIKESSIPPFQDKSYYRIGSTLGHPLALGMFLAQIAPLFVIFYAKADSVLKRIVWLVAVIALALTLLVTFGKGPWFTAVILSAVVIVGLLWRKPKARKPVIVLVFAVILSVALFFIAFHESTTAGTFSKARKSESLSPRKYMWSRAPAVIKANPVFGVGMWRGGEEVLKIDFMDLGEYQPTAIDNLYIDIIVEQGIVGALMILGTLVFLFKQVLELIRNGGAYLPWAIALFISMSVPVINGMTMDTLWIWPGMVVFWLMAGMMRALYEMKGRKIDLGAIL